MAVDVEAAMNWGATACTGLTLTVKQMDEGAQEIR